MEHYGRRRGLTKTAATLKEERGRLNERFEEHWVEDAVANERLSKVSQCSIPTSPAGLMIPMSTSVSSRKGLEISWTQDGKVEVLKVDGNVIREAISKALASEALVSTGYSFKLNSALTHLVNAVLDEVKSIPADEVLKRNGLADYLFNTFHAVFSQDISFQFAIFPQAIIPLWIGVLEVVWKWEDRNGEIHKGSAYYWLADRYFAAGDIISGNLCMSSAAAQDNKNSSGMGNSEESPANKSYSLSGSPDNSLYLVLVKPVRDMLAKTLSEYSRKTTRALTMKTLDGKFLQNVDFADIKRFFSMTLFEVYHFDDMRPYELIQNDYARLKRMYTLFSLCLVADQLLQHGAFGKADKTMASAIVKLAEKLKWIPPYGKMNEKKQIADFMNRLSPSVSGDDLDKAIPMILDGNVAFDGHRMDPLMKAVFVTHRIRNFSAHKVKGQSVSLTRYDEILESVLFTIFVAVELY